MEEKLELVKREVIKPASPAPHDRLELSIVDLSSPGMYVSQTFFYKSIIGESSEIISTRLRSSLSETLSRFYPLAGRIEGFSISCTDEGAIYTEAHTNLSLSDFLKNNLSNTESLGEFFPAIAPGESAMTWPLLSVKVIFFGSGSGFAVTVAISHKICDATSLLTFVNGWAVTTKGESNDVAVTTPQFAGATIFPPPPHSSFQYPSTDDLSNNLFQARGKCVTNRFVFKSSKIAELKRKAASKSVPIPTRVEVITSLIWRCAVNSSRSNSAAPRSTLMTQPMDIRLRVPSTVLSSNAIGNLQSSFFLKKDPKSDMEISEMVAEFRKAKQGVNEMIKENLQGYNTTTLGQKLLSVMENFISELKPETDIYPMSSCCEKSFYKVDFGWGTPVWVGSASHTIYENLVFVLLLDSKNGEDVEAWVSLPKQAMSYFICDQDLLAYTIINPPVLITKGICKL